MCLYRVVGFLASFLLLSIYIIQTQSAVVVSYCWWCWCWCWCYCYLIDATNTALAILVDSIDPTREREESCHWITTFTLLMLRKDPESVFIRWGSSVSSPPWNKEREYSSWRRFVQKQLLLSLQLSTNSEIRSGHRPRQGGSSCSVLSIDVERSADQFLLSGGLDGRVCLYRFDSMPTEKDSGNSRKGHSVIFPTNTSSSMSRSSNTYHGEIEGHQGAVSSVKW